MALLDLWNEKPEQLKDKQVQQLIAFAGDGKLLDTSECSKEFRAFLTNVPSTNLINYANQILNIPFTDSGMALQDIVNEIGERLGATVSRGLYHGKKNSNGFDGLWKFPSGHSIIVEVKTTSAFNIALDTISNYRKKLIESNEVSEEKSSILLIIGKQQTQDLEAQIRGSRHAWDIRLISINALVNLMSIKEDLEDPKLVQRIHQILIPREFTRLDDIAEILFSAAEEIKQDIFPINEHEKIVDTKSKEPKLTPVSFHEACIHRIEPAIHEKLIKRTKAQYSTADKTTFVNCAVSKEHSPDINPNYWFSFHPHQREALSKAAKAFVAFGCGTSKQIILIPFSEFDPLLDGMWATENEDRKYWHVVIYHKNSKYLLHRKKGQKVIDLTSYLIS